MHLLDRQRKGTPAAGTHIPVWSVYRKNMAGSDVGQGGEGACAAFEPSARPELSIA